MNKRIALIGLLFFLTQACTESSPGEEDEGGTTTPPVEVDLYDFDAAAPWFECPTGNFPAEATAVPALNQVYQRFGTENTRDVQSNVSFPETGDWGQIGMLVKLECPESGLCDHWDRAASVQLITNPDAAPEDYERVELARFITPYKIEMCQYVDVTAMAPLLQGNKAVTSWIDTWVGEGHAQGEGWRTTVSFVFYPGSDLRPKEIVNVWSRRNITVGEIEPESNVDAQIEPFTFTLPDVQLRKVEAHLITTGHSFGNSLNCAEFCQMQHDIVVNGETYSINPWRGDCEQNPVSPQYGTWEYGRNGWCPGAITIGDRVDITRDVQAGENTLDFDILLANGLEYDNTSPVELLPYSIVSLKLYVWY